MAALGSSIAIANQRIERLHLDQTCTCHIVQGTENAHINLDITTFHAKSYAQTLRHEVYPNVASASSELRQLAAYDFKISPKDHWDQNGVLNYFSKWSDTGREAAFWVGGRSGNQEPWVTEMSVDLIRALESQEKTTVYVFCDGIHGALTPSVLAQRLIVQLLESFPLLAFHNPEIFNTTKLNKAQTFVQLWSICQMLVDQAGEVFVVIDRIDKCKPEDGAGVEDIVLPYLVQLTKSCPQVSVVLTADRNPPLSLQVDKNLQSVWISAERPPGKRNDKKYGGRD